MRVKYFPTLLFFSFVFCFVLFPDNIHSSTSSTSNLAKHSKVDEDTLDYKTEENNSSIAIIISTLSITIAFAVWFISFRNLRHSEKIARREATQAIFNEWWDKDLSKKRKYFYLEFLPKYRQKLICKSFKEIEDVIGEDNDNVKELCFFFDKVGWLGAAGLIDVDYVLGPMQHTMRRIWWVMEDLIKEERKKDSTSNTNNYLDPVFQFGFEWLFIRSKKPKNHQANLLKSRFRNPSLLNNFKIETLKAKIDKEDKEFQKNLRTL